MNAEIKNVVKTSFTAQLLDPRLAVYGLCVLFTCCGTVYTTLAVTYDTHSLFFPYLTVGVLCYNGAAILGMGQAIIDAIKNK